MSADGNCFFNSLSVALCGNEDRAAEFRLRTAIEMIINRPMYSSLATSPFTLVSPDYEEAVKDCVTDCSYSCAWTFIAAANVLQVNIFDTRHKSYTAYFHNLCAISIK